MIYTTDMHEGMHAETVEMTGANGDKINAYYAQPIGPGPFPGMVLAHHMPGWDAWYKEATRTFAQNGYATITPNLYFRAGHGTPEDVAAKVRAAGGIADELAVGDLAGAMAFLRSQPLSSGKVGIFGTCSGGRHACLAACQAPGFDAVVDCWGGSVVMPPETLSPLRPVAPIDLTKNLPCPILGLFGKEDQNPTPAMVAQHEKELKKHGKEFEFHMYAGAGHGFFYHHRPAYRQEQAVDGWEKIWAFLDRCLSSS
jgi:carboxymethylenebutenolidase